MSIIRDVETGRREGHFRPATIAAVEAALGWAPGSYQRVVEGGSPTASPDLLMARLLEVWPELSRDARALIVGLAETAHAGRWGALG